MYRIKSGMKVETGKQFLPEAWIVSSKLHGSTILILEDASGRRQRSKQNKIFRTGSILVFLALLVVLVLVVTTEAAAVVVLALVGGGGGGRILGAGASRAVVLVLLALLVFLVFDVFLVLLILVVRLILVVLVVTTEAAAVVVGRQAYIQNPETTTKARFVLTVYHGSKPDTKSNGKQSGKFHNARYTAVLTLGLFCELKCWQFHMCLPGHLKKQLSIFIPF